MSDAARPPAAAAPARRRWLGALARAPRAELEGLWAALADKPRFSWLRRPELGLVMVRARIGGTGDRFNLGEMTVTRCAVRIESGPSGVGYVAGRAPRKAEIVALADALLQDPARHAEVIRAIVEPLERRAAERASAMHAAAQATKVDFFTLVREGDGGEPD